VKCESLAVPQMDRDKVFWGVRCVAELDSEVRNSLPPCGLCQEIVVAVRFSVQMALWFPGGIMCAPHAGHPIT
jgi:hypothetical protein